MKQYIDGFLCLIRKTKDTARGSNIIDNYVRENRGFTLIELLVVIAIIGTLSTIGFLALTGASDGATDAKKLAELQSIRSAATVELSKNRTYPIVTAGLVTIQACARLDQVSGSVVATLEPMVKQLSGMDLKNYVYCSNGTGTEFLVATDIKGKLPAATTGAPTGSKGNSSALDLPSKAIASTTVASSANGLVKITCAAVGSTDATYCIGNL